MTNKIRKKPFYKTLGFYFTLIYGLITITLVIQIFTINFLPMKIALPIVIILMLLLFGMAFLQLGHKVNKANVLLGRILIVLLSVILGVGNWYLFNTGSALSRMTGDNSQTSIVSIVVLKNNTSKSVADIKNDKFGVSKAGNQDIIAKAKADLAKDIAQQPTLVEFKSYKELGDDLYDGKITAIILDEATRGMFEDNHLNFSKETKVIKSYKYKTNTKDISKNVNVTTEPFNLYITGIDTFGSISTVSRSDVNMIASINPKTHQILLTSIPRDYYIPQTCQGNQKDKLTHSGIFGVSCTVDSIQNFMGIDINYYARVNFSSVINIVDSLGGITVNSPIPFSALGFDFTAGDNYLSGEEALAFSRERYSLAGGDVDRGKNQMRVITGIVNKVISPKIITNYTNVLDAISGSFQTNLSNGELSSLIKMQVNDMRGWEIEQISVNGTGLNDTWSPANGFNSYVMEPDMNTVNNAVELINKMKTGEDIKILAKQGVQ